MGIIRRSLRLAEYSGYAAIVAFVWKTRNAKFVDMPISDHIFHSSYFHKLNPERNPTTHDLYIQKVPLSDINPALLNTKGKLVEAFCAGVWSGSGYAIQRAYMAMKYQGPETAQHLWSRSELNSSSYEPGTIMTDHFEVIEKTPERIVVRCGGSPRIQEVRESDGLFEMSATVKPEEGVAEFGVKSCFFQGLGKAESQPMPFHIAWLHRQYSKLLLATAVKNVLR